MRLKVIDIGKVVKYKGIRLIVTPAVERCRGCFFKRIAYCHTDVVGACCKPWRNEDVIFRKYDNEKQVNNHQALSAYEHRRKA